MRANLSVIEKQMDLSKSLGTSPISKPSTAANVAGRPQNRFNANNKQDSGHNEKPR